MIMRTDKEKDLILKAVDGYKRRLVVVDRDNRIVASSYDDEKDDAKSPVGQFCYQFIYNCDEPCRDCIAHKTMQYGTPFIRTDYSGVNRVKKERCRYSYPIKDEEETHAAVVMDYEEPGIREMEDQLRRSNAFLHNLINSAVDGVIAADMSGKIIIFNESAAEITGHSVEYALENLDIRKMYSPGVAEEVMRLLRSDEYGGPGKLKGYRADGMNKAGQVMPISLNAAIVYEGEKEVATIGFFHDLREYLEMQAQLKKTQIQLLQAEKMSSLGKLAAGVAHQLNNPLGGITLFSKLILEDYDLPDGARDDIGRILRDAQRCSDTVKELLEFARQTKREMHPLDINKSISRTFFLLESQTIFHNILIECNYDNNLPMVSADSQQFNHVLMNIILNAADAMEGSGKLTIITGRVPDKNRIFIEITDTGGGIPEHVLPHIFEPFFTTKEEGKGTGLGLSMVYGIIENHGGTIAVESELGKGTKFRIELLQNNEGGTLIG
jgi:PAS domain S-box-containing protein